MVAKHKKVLTFERARGGAWPTELAAVALGPTGNLRAPALRVGSSWLVGFDEGVYSAELDS